PVRKGRLELVCPVEKRSVQTFQQGLVRDEREQDRGDQASPALRVQLDRTQHARQEDEGGHVEQIDPSIDDLLRPERVALDDVACHDQEDQQQLQEIQA